MEVLSTDRSGVDSTTIRVLPGLVLRLRVMPTAWLLIAVHLIVTGTRLARSWWWQDDLNLLALARQPLNSSLLLTDYNGHLVPGTFALGWLIDRIGSLEWWPAALFVLLLTAGCDLALLGLLRRMFGTRPGILVPLALYTGTTLTLTSTVWWAAAMQWLPVTLSLALALYGHVSYTSTGRVRYAVLSVGAVVFGLLFFEKALTTPLVLGLFAIGYGVRGNWLVRPWRVFLARPGYWLAQLGVAVGFLAIYLSHVTPDTGGSAAVAARGGTGFGDYLTLIRFMLLESFVPSLLGGPISWYSTPATTVNAWPDPPWWFSLLTSLIALAVIVFSIRARRGAWRAWALLAVFLAVSIGLVARARLGFVGPFIGRDHRYVSDAAMLAAICLALALMPLLPGLDRSSAAAEGADGADGADGGSAPPGPGRRRGRVAARSGAPAWLTSPSIGLAVVLVMTVGGVLSGENFMKIWTRNPTQAYFDNLRTSLADSREPVVLFPDETVPDLVMTPTFEEDRRLRNVGAVLDRQPVFRDWATAISTVGPDGKIVPAAVDADPVSLPAPACSGTSGRIVVRLPAAVQEWRWKIELGYLAGRPTSADVQLGVNGAPVSLEFTRELGNVYLETEAGPAATLILENIDPAVNVCIGTVAIGKDLKAKPAS